MSSRGQRDFAQRVTSARQALMSIRVEMQVFILDLGDATAKPKQIGDTATVHLGLLDWIESSRSVRRIADIEWAIRELSDQIAQNRDHWLHLRESIKQWGSRR